jgi:hypothetical protein
MPAPPPPAVEEGQFEDAPIDRHPDDYRGGDNYIDDTPSEQSEDSSEEDDDFDSDDPDTLARVEDEDWEIAERGTRQNPTLLYFSF